VIQRGSSDIFKGEGINVMRYLNSGVLGTLNLYLFWLIFRGKMTSNHQAVLTYLMPINFTFMFLFYTETASLTSLLILYYRIVCLRDKSALNLLLGILSLLMRQTNIIWINYFAVITLVREAKECALTALIVNKLMKLPSIAFEYLWLVALDALFVGFVYWNNGSIVLGH
jgi:hypothetical protein